MAAIQHTQDPVQMYSRVVTRQTANKQTADPFNSLTRGHAIQVNFIEGVTIEDYVIAVADEVGPENVIAASKCDRMAKIFVKENDMADYLCANGLQINGHYLDVHPLQKPYTKLTLSGVPPFIPNEVLLHNLRPFGKPVSAMRYIPLGCKSEKLSHVKSFRRQVNFKFDPSTPLGSSMNIPFNEDVFRIYTSTDDNKVRCQKCRKFGHATEHCKAIIPAADNVKPSTSNNTKENDLVVAHQPSAQPITVGADADIGDAPALEPPLTHPNSTTPNATKDDGPGNAPTLELPRTHHTVAKTSPIDTELCSTNPKRIKTVASESSAFKTAPTLELPRENEEMAVSDNDDDNMSVASQSSLTSEHDINPPCKLLSTETVLEFIDYTKGSPNPLKKAREFTDNVEQLYWSLRRHRSSTKLSLGEKRKIQRLLNSLKPSTSITK